MSTRRRTTRAECRGPSPFPPIADYAFLSNCHTGALVALDGAIDWFCVPTSTRPACSARCSTGALAISGSDRLGSTTQCQGVCSGDECARDDLEDTQRLGRGSRRADHGPANRDDEVTPHTRPPADDDCDHMLVRTVRCLEGQIEIELVCEPAFDYGRIPAEWTLVDGSRHTADATGAGQSMRLRHMAVGIEGNRARARRILEAGEELYCSLSWAATESATDVEDANRRLDTTTGYWRNWLGRRESRTTAGASRSSVPPWPSRGSPICRPGPRLRPSRLAARDPGRRAQLGLPLHLDARLDLHLAGPALPESRLGGRRFMQFVADLEPNQDGALQIMYGIDGRRDLTESTRDELSGYAGAARYGSETERSTNGRTTSSAPCSTRSCSTPGAATGSPDVCGRSSNRRPSAPRPSGTSRTRASGRPAASRTLRVFQAHELGGLDRAAKLAEFGRHGRPGHGATAEEIKADILGTALATVACCASTTTPMPRRVHSSGAVFGFLPPDDERLRTSSSPSRTS